MKDRNVEFPNRYQLNKVAGTDDIYDMIPAPGIVNEEGTVLNKSQLDTYLAGKGVTTGTSTAYILNDTDFNLTDGALIRFKLHVDSGATPTININNTGAKAIMSDAYRPMRAGVKAGTWLSAVYSSTLGFFVLQGSMANETKKLGNGTGQISMSQWFLMGHFAPMYIIND